MRPTAATIALLLAFPALVYACGLDDTIIAESSGGDGGAGGRDATVGGDSGGPLDGGDTDGGGTGDGGSLLPPTPVYAISGTALYELDTSNSILKNLGPLTSCNDSAIDIAITPSNQLYVVTQDGSNRDVAVLSMAGTCSQQQRLDSSHTLSIGYSGTAPASLLELRDDDDTLELLDPTNGSDSSLQGGALPSDAVTDIACDSAKCWYLVPHNHCTPDPGTSSTCLFDMDPDGSNGTQYRILTNIGISGMAYYGKFLYLFVVGTPTIYKVDLTNPTAAVGSVMPTGDPAPSSWLGAASSSTYL